MINLYGNKMVVSAALEDGLYVIDKLCPQADVHHVIRRLRDNEEALEAWESQRSDDAFVVRVNCGSWTVVI